MKIGIVFAGQGAQYSGMGKDLYETYPEAKTIFDMAGDQVKAWCFEGDEETLKQTHVTQPTIYTTTMAAYEAFMAEIKKQAMTDDLEVVALAGFSLGEYSALTAAGAIDEISKGIDIVSKRGVLMQQAGLDEEGNAKGGMAAGIGDRKAILEAVEDAREDGILEGVNFNSPVQTVVAGDKAALKRFRRAAKAKGVKAIPLGVSTAFHSPMMIPAAEKLKDVLLEADLKAPKKKVYANVTADDIMKDFDGQDEGQYLTDMLAKQAMSPVYWEEIIKKFQTEGVKAIVEVGPGKTLTGLTKKTCPEIAALNVENVETLQNAVAQLKELI
ncbi:ACP S-malonyltransferase [Mogibacterium sp. NSJ-24]|jgi:[acyl-carrier-protein] S-malonyltransferase|uniref:Malonyl CoA-acyl carrier protein transacylase n=1 Tax=Lentihominibacter hominis TaxID=2763645 RepID=A0A926I9N0_9FIRM|nr:ACP S-malonyltransferase [Lentihominibacter hominis]MBC8568202.1 ACP S-malonyltransferase [Lentihominibacter hominis]